MIINRTRRALAAFASTAVAAAGLAAFAPAAQAEDAGLSFTCRVNTPGLGDVLTGETFKLTAALTLPAKVEQNVPFSVKLTGTVAASERTRSTAEWLGTKDVSGSAVVEARLGEESVKFDAAVAKTAVPGAGSVLVLPVTGAGNWKASVIGTHNITVSKFSAPLTLAKADGSGLAATAFCDADASDAVLGTVEVVAAAKPATSKTTAKVKYSKKSKKATVTTSVTVGKKAASGKVKIKLAKGKKTVKTVTVKLNKSGKASASFKKIATKGKYTATVSYAGSSSVKKSSKKVTFTVK